MKSANLLLRFVLELAALASLGYWGATVDTAFVSRAMLAVALPIAAAIFWGLFVAPRAHVVLPTVTRMTLGLIVFACAALALAGRGHERLAAGFFAAATVNVLLMLAWRQDRIVRD